MISEVVIDRLTSLCSLCWGLARSCAKKDSAVERVKVHFLVTLCPFLEH